MVVVTEPSKEFVTTTATGVENVDIGVIVTVVLVVDCVWERTVVTAEVHGVDDDGWPSEVMVDDGRGVDDDVELSEPVLVVELESEVDGRVEVVVGFGGDVLLVVLVVVEVVVRVVVVVPVLVGLVVVGDVPVLVGLPSPSPLVGGFLVVEVGAGLDIDEDVPVDDGGG